MLIGAGNRPATGFSTLTRVAVNASLEEDFLGGDNVEYALAAPRYGALVRDMTERRQNRLIVAEPTTLRISI